MRSNSMSNAMRRLVSDLGESFGRVEFAWLLQKYNVMPWDEVPGEMISEIYGK